MELLKALYRISSPSRDEYSMAKSLRNYCERIGCLVTTDKTGNLYVTKGTSETYPCIVAHMDEVYPERPQGYDVLEVNGRLFGFDTINCTQCGIGGDDKNGIWIALKCLCKFDVLKCAFFVGEEVGCVGSYASDSDWFNDCRFVVQCDRRGNSDLITSIWSELCSDEFIEDVNPTAYGYAPNEGMLTDVLALKQNGLNVSAVNISCGYYNPHSKGEYTVIEDLNKCLRFVEHIIKDCTKVYIHKYDSMEYNSKSRAKYYIPSTREEQLIDLESMLLEDMPYGYYSSADEAYEWLKDDYNRLTRRDFVDVYNSVSNDIEESYRSMQNDLRGKLINNPNLSLEEFEDEMAWEYGLSCDHIRTAYDDIMS